MLQLTGYSEVEANQDEVAQLAPITLAQRIQASPENI
jgi:hypothetical protein